ncbi:pyridoxamine 5'-phosphate oxidase family protein [Rhodococcus erythropolis]|uniref:pyridoxamine 5'-phosphate oxidase family protein n=1 Tax=Rhodococcus erythropolis TaxID=1833 RepID=UPI001BEA84AE|nr:pyridoxamine 5'-phosphate oxidase family protein [Rhodococcus erythropolis]MBT2263735.1 pyridoxamine 5'-phosphate oxidase family protein [Rhodococcus erythropolis]
MSTRYAHIAFSPAAVERQRSTGSFTVYGSKLDQPDEGPMEFDFRAQGFVKSVDSFFMSTVTPDGWPYVQHRGGPRGFLHVLGPNRIGFADLPGNQQFVTLGNLEVNNRISLFVIDYPTRTRLKIYGRAQVIEADENPALLEQLLQVPGGTMTAKAQRSIVIDVEAFDWNCSRNITPRFDKERMDESLALARQPLQAEVDRLTAEVEELRALLSENE